MTYIIIVVFVYVCVIHICTGLCVCKCARGDRSVLCNADVLFVDSLVQCYIALVRTPETDTRFMKDQYIYIHVHFNINTRE